MSRLAAAYAMKKKNSGYVEHDGDDVKPNPAAAKIDMMAYNCGGMVDRIMKARKYSQGGMVANDVGVAEADKLPAEYDDLVLRDDLEFSYDAANSGDELGSEAQDERDADMVSRIMRSRAKKDRNPRPA